MSEEAEQLFYVTKTYAIKATTQLEAAQKTDSITRNPKPLGWCAVRANNGERDQVGMVNITEKNCLPALNNKE